jgi:GAF domain-containing protein
MSIDINATTLEKLAKAVEGYRFPTATFRVVDDGLKLLAISNLGNNAQQDDLQKKIFVNLVQFQDKLEGDQTNHFWLNGDEFELAPELFDFASRLDFEKAFLLFVASDSSVHGLVMVGSYDGQELTEEAIIPYVNSVNLACTILQQAEKAGEENISVARKESFPAIVDAIKTPWDTTAFFATLHENIKHSIGNYAFTGALYDEKTKAIHIPYMYEEGETQTIDSVPLGEGLTSILLRTKKPLLLVEDTEEQSNSLGAKTIGKTAKSWMGVPLIIDDRAIGALIVQDLEKEKAFTQDDLDYLKALSSQVAGILYNAQLLDENRVQIARIQAAAEIARDISSALELDELLLKAVNLIRDRFDFYHAAIFLIDTNGANAVIREATGEAGLQLKRSGHKLAVGSNSVVGFVAGKGEPLVVNDTAQDATHLPNPLLPDTRAEAAVPMKIGDRTLGVLDVQSRTPFSFGPSDMNTLQILADQVAIAVNNTELFAETQEHLSQHRLLHHITTSAASGTTLEESLNSTVKGLQVTLGGDRVAILLADAERINLVTKAWVGYSEETTNLTVPFGTGITGWVAAHRKPLRVDDVTQDTRYIEVSSNTRSELALPIIFQNEILGVLNVESEQVGAYTENDEEMLGTLVGSLAAIISNARLVEQIRAQAERERQLYEITSKIRQSTDLQTILSTTINEISRVTGARKTQISVGIKQDEVTPATTKPPANPKD